jgi:hypothetical protein
MRNKNIFNFRKSHFKTLLFIGFILLSHSGQTQPIFSAIEGYLELKNVPDTTSIYLGRKAGLEMPIGFLHNTLLSSNTGKAGTLNTIAGSSAGRFQTGSTNSVFGASAGLNNQSNNCSFFGYLAGINSTTGNGNVLFGASAGTQIASGGSNICLGNSSGPSVANSGLFSRLYINNFSSDQPLIGGNFLANTITIDGALEVKSPLNNQAFNQNVTFDGQTLTVAGHGYIRVSSDSSTASNRTIALTNGLNTGQILILENAGPANTFWEMQETGTINLAGSHIFGPDDNIRFIWNGNKWTELNYSDN